MPKQLPEHLVQAEQARMFPVLPTTSKERPTSSIVSACMAKIDEFGGSLRGSLGQKVGACTKIEACTEVVCNNRTSNIKYCPDDLIASLFRLGGI